MGAPRVRACTGPPGQGWGLGLGLGWGWGLGWGLGLGLGSGVGQLPQRVTVPPQSEQSVLLYTLLELRLGLG